MKNSFVLFVSFLMSLSLFAQEEIIESSPVKKQDRVIIGLFHDQWKGLPQGVEVKGINRGFMMNLMYDFPLGQAPVAFAVGLGISCHNLYTNARPYNELVNGQYTGKTLFIPIDSIYSGGPFSYSINKLNVNYFEVPAELRLRVRTGNNFLKLSLGAKAGIVFNAHTKYKGDDLSGMPGRIKVKDLMIRNIDVLRYSVYGRLAWSSVGIFYSMQLTSLFVENKGPEMIPVSIGLNFTL
jgi:hypothetical protein